MNRFDYKLELVNLDGVKTKTGLRKLVVKYRKAYDNNYAVNDLTTYFVGNSTVVNKTLLDTVKHNYLLYTEALKRYKELETDHNKLSLYMRHNGKLNLQVTPEVAIKILELLKENNEQIKPT